MAFVPKEWKDRLVEFAGRRKLTNVATGEEIIFDVARNEGAVSQEGDAFSAENMNDLEQRVADEFTQINSDLSFPDGVGFYPDVQDGVRGYNTDAARGADTFVPFKSKIHQQLYLVRGYYDGNTLYGSATIYVSKYSTLEIKTNSDPIIVYGQNNNIIATLSSSNDYTIVDISDNEKITIKTNGSKTLSGTTVDLYVYL